MLWLTLYSACTLLQDFVLWLTASFVVSIILQLMLYSACTVFQEFVASILMWAIPYSVTDIFQDFLTSVMLWLIQCSTCLTFQNFMASVCTIVSWLWCPSYWHCGRWCGGGGGSGTQGFWGKNWSLIPACTFSSFFFFFLIGEHFAHTSSTLYVRISPQWLSKLRWLWLNVLWWVACEFV